MFHWFKTKDLSLPKVFVFNRNITLQLPASDGLDFAIKRNRDQKTIRVAFGKSEERRREDERGTLFECWFDAQDVQNHFRGNSCPALQPFPLLKIRSLHSFWIVEKHSK